MPMAIYPDLFIMNRGLCLANIKHILNIINLRDSGIKLLPVHEGFYTCFTSSQLVATRKELEKYLLGLNTQDLPISLTSTGTTTGSQCIK